MSAYMYITLSLLVYPIAGYFLVRLTRHQQRLQKFIVLTFITLSLLTILGLLTHTITISQNLNWLLITATYLTLSVLLWLVHFSTIGSLKTIGKVVMVFCFGLGYLAATAGFFFVMLASNDLETDQGVWLTNDLVYKERNIGQGPDPSVRLKEVEVYKKVSWFPLVATRLEAKTYDEWNLPLKRQLDVSYSDQKEILYLSSVVEGYKTFAWADTISLRKKHYR